MPSVWGFRPLPPASDLPFYDIFASQKLPLLKIGDDAIACNLWVGPHLNQKSWLRLCVRSVCYRHDFTRAVERA